MKKLKLLLFILPALLAWGCGADLKEDIILFNGQYVELDAAVYNTRASGKTYPLLTRLPQGGRPVILTSVPAQSVVADPLITRSSGKITLQVNLVAAQRSNAETLTYKVVSDESTAVANVHYKTSGTVQIPANSSFGYIEVEILNAGAATGSRTLVLELESNSTLKSNPNYNQVGISISQI